ncbi:acyl-CoA thioesterase-1 [Palleronia aestuarii]|uniref:Acyl-CoA thioesterase-1 n=1 Tax=Palleronia aestuarii TaxID=568105 RepID=A0A2W7NSN5_9RHOB|nr:acyl-CoA thioesterase-1 [Palleronia aestuarii]
MGYGPWRGLAKLALVFVLAGPVAAETLQVAALGDSLTQGYGLPPSEGFVPQLQEWLDAEGADAEVLNAGVSGDTTAGGLSRVDWTLTPDVDAMIVALGGNDLLRGIDPATSRENLDGILAAAEEAGVPVLLVGIDAPPNYGPEYKAAFDGMYTDLAEEHDTLLVPDFLGALSRLPDREAAMARFMQPDGIHPNAEGVTRIVDELGPEVLSLLKRARAE